jgi:hypothetical protein
MNFCLVLQIVLDDLSRAREGFVLESNLHSVYLVIPISDGKNPNFWLGVNGATPTAGLGVVEPPPWPRGWSGHPKKAKKKKKKGFGILGVAESRYGVAEAAPMPLGVVRPPQKAKKKKKKEKMGFGLLGVAEPLPRA